MYLLKSSVINRYMLSLGKRSRVDVMVSVDSHNLVDMDINLHQFSRDTDPLLSDGVTGIHGSVVNVVGFVNPHNNTMSRGDPLKFSSYMNPLRGRCVCIIHEMI